MENPNFEISAMNEKINRLEKTQVIKNYYLVLGGGKIGTDFLHYARKNKFPFVLVIDRDETAPASDEADIKTEVELVNLLKNKASEPSPNKVFKSPRVSGAIKREDEGESEKEGREPEIYFCKMDLKHIPFLLSHGIPEYIIPAVPCHAVAYMLSDLLKFPLEPAKNENPEKIEDKSQKGSSPVTELIIGPENQRLMAFSKSLQLPFLLM